MVLVKKVSIQFPGESKHGKLTKEGQPGYAFILQRVTLLSSCQLFCMFLGAQAKGVFVIH